MSFQQDSRVGRYMGFQIGNDLRVSRVYLPRHEGDCNDGLIQTNNPTVGLKRPERVDTARQLLPLRAGP